MNNKIDALTDLLINRGLDCHEACSIEDAVELIEWHNVAHTYTQKQLQQCCVSANASVMASLINNAYDTPDQSPRALELQIQSYVNEFAQCNVDQSPAFIMSETQTPKETQLQTTLDLFTGPQSYRCVIVRGEESCVSGIHSRGPYASEFHYIEVGCEGTHQDCVRHFNEYLSNRPGV